MIGFCSTQLIQSVCACAAQYVTAGANPISVKKGIDKTCDFLVDEGV